MTAAGLKESDLPLVSKNVLGASALGVFLATLMFVTTWCLTNFFQHPPVTSAASSLMPFIIVFLAPAVAIMAAGLLVLRRHRFAQDLAAVHDRRKSVFGAMTSKIFERMRMPVPVGTLGVGASSAATSVSDAGPTGSARPVDVAAVLDGMASRTGQEFDWRHSIVDLMKLLGMDSSLTARKELAHELEYTGDINDSTTMNVWLHREVMLKFLQNGGELHDRIDESSRPRGTQPH